MMRIDDTYVRLNYVRLTVVRSLVAPLHNERGRTRVFQICAPHSEEKRMYPVFLRDLRSMPTFI